MGVYSCIKNLFNNKENESYTKAIKCIYDAKEKINSMIVVFPDITISEMIFIKNKWQKLSGNIGSGVSVLGLSIGGDDKVLVTHFAEKGFLVPHEHDNNFEMNKVISGSVYDDVNKKTYKTGDIFTINKGIRHSLKSKSESMLLTIFSIDVSKLIVPENLNLDSIKFQ